MTCERMELAILAVIDGRATDAERRQAEAHVAACRDCAERMEQMRATWAALDSLPGLEPSAGFDARLWARLTEKPSRKAWLGWFPAHVRLVATVAALIVVAAWISLHLPMRKPTPVSPKVQTQEDFVVVKNLPVLEDYDVVSNFEALSALPGAQSTSDTSSQPMD